MTGVEDQLRAELRREAERYQPSLDAWARLQQQDVRRARSWLPALAAAAVVLAAVIGTVVAVRGHHSTASSAAGPVPDACLNLPANPTLLTNPGFDTAPMSGYLAGGMFCLNIGNQYWGTPVGTGTLPAVGLTGLRFTIDFGDPLPIIAGLTGAGGGNVRLADADSHQPISCQIRYAVVGNQRAFFCLLPKSYRHVAVSLVDDDGTVLDIRTVTPQNAVVHD